VKLWLLYDDNGCYEGPWLRAVCTSLESAQIAKEKCDAIAGCSHEICETRTDAFWVEKEYKWLEDLYHEPFRRHEGVDIR
jgi:hypothetical protein